MKNASVVLLSGGLDSAVNLFAAMRETTVRLAITFNYGQKAAQKEIEAARSLIEEFNIEHKVIDLPWFKGLGNSALNHNKVNIPTGKNVSIDNLATSKTTAKAVWVPNRNGLFLNVAACYAESYKCNLIIPGFNREEAITFPDNSLDFIRATRKAFSFSTANHVDVQCYTVAMGKIEIVELGRKLNVPFHKMWPCYQDGDEWCGVCESCQRAKRAFKAAKEDISDMFAKY